MRWLLIFALLLFAAPAAAWTISQQMQTFGTGTEFVIIQPPAIRFSAPPPPPPRHYHHHHHHHKSVAPPPPQRPAKKQGRPYGYTRRYSF